MTAQQAKRVQRLQRKADSDIAADGNVIPMWRRHLKEVLHSPSCVISIAVIVIMLLFSFVGPFFSPYQQNGLDIINAKQAPTVAHLLGTDEYGRDILTRLMYAGRISLTVGLASMALSLIIGTVIGLVCGYYGGWVDATIMRLADLLMSIPGLPLLIIIAAMLSSFKVPPESRPYIVMLMLSLIGWPGLARMVRSEVLSLREQLYMKAADALGLGTHSKMFHHLLPNVYPLLIVVATLSTASSILSESTLSFLGMGVMPPNASWGNMISAANNMIDFQKRWWLWIPPGTAILVTVIAINVLGNRLQDILDPKSERSAA